MSAKGSALRPLPGPLPEGESILWRAAPRAKSVVVRHFRLPLVALYFAGLLAVATISALMHGTGAGAVALFAALASGAMAILACYGWLVARGTVYTLTTRRLILQVGVALPITVNIPFRQIAGARLKLFADGTGQIEVMPSAATRMSFLLLWPHASPWRLGRPRPLLLGVPDAQAKASAFARAVAAAAGGGVTVTVEPVAAAPGARPAPVSAPVVA